MYTQLKNRNLEAALGYARRGWAVFPCRIDKKPLTQKGFKDATTDEFTVKAWWTERPDASIGVPTGSKNRIVVLDVDVDKDKDGNVALQALTRGVVPKTLAATTGRGGTHYFFEHPGIHIGSSAGKLGEGLDIRGDGGYVIVSPSNHPSGRSYEWQNDLPIAPMPDWLLRAIEAPEAPALKRQVQDADPFEFGTDIPEGRRNHKVFRYAAGLRAGGMEHEDILATIRSLNKLSCKPPLDEDELRGIADSASQYQPEPRGEPRSQKAKALSTDTKELNDAGNAARFVEAHGSCVRYVKSIEKWLIYDGARWKEDKLGKVQELAKETARKIHHEAAETADKNDRMHLSSWAENSGNKTKLKAMVDLATSDPHVARLADDFDKEPFDLCVRNGVLDLTNGELRPHSPDDMITKMAPVEFDSGAACPQFRQFLDQVTANDQDLQRYMQKVAGYCLTADMREQVFFIVYGLGSNGKSVFIDVIAQMMGEYAMTTDFKTFLEQKSQGPRNDIAALWGCRFAIGSEIGPGGHLDETVVKQVTGQDSISARYLYKEFDVDKMVCKIFLATNHLPTIRGTEHGIWRRVRVIPFDVTIKDDQVDRQLAEKLKTELPGILNWAVEGCLLWQKEGLTPPKRVVEAGHKYRLEADTVEQFIQECCVKDPKAEVKSSEFYHRYEEYCDNNGLTAIHMTTFFKKLTEKEIGTRRSETSYRTGIRMLTLEERRLKRTT
ncbi:MAG: bifunctional DNA primase/polymerase [Armatimonadetes bacterium]|nr:bifunctional DNA primase/polymerase [Armatimonadota bacterium]